MEHEHSEEACRTRIAAVSDATFVYRHAAGIPKAEQQFVWDYYNRIIKECREAMRGA